MELPSISRKFIDSHLSSQVELVDKTEDGLALYCYKECDNSSKNTVKHCHGLVFHENELVCRSFPYTHIIPVSHTEEVEQVFAENPLEECVFTPSYEGTLLRVFSFNGRWLVSTHKKLDAYNSRWGGDKTFGRIFDEAVQNEKVENLFSYLDTSKVYSFLVSDNSSRIACISPQARIFLAGVYSNQRLDLEDDTVPIPSLPKLNFTALDNLYSWVYNSNPYHVQGVMVFTKSGKVVRVCNEKYIWLSQIRGTEPNLIMRYFQLRDDPRFAEFLEMFSEKKELFEAIETEIVEIAKRLKRIYFDRYASKRHIVCDKTTHELLKKCHDWHRLNRESNRISVQTILKFMREATPENNYHWYSNGIYEKETQKLKTEV